MLIVRPKFNPSTIGYSRDYYIQTPIEKRYIGSVTIDKPDREAIGYYGTEYHTATEDIVLSNKKIIPKGAEYFTRLIKLNGRDENFYNTVIKVFGDVSAE